MAAGATNRQNKSREKLPENSTCSVWGKGGDESALACLNSLDQDNYNRWLKSVETNPQVIELEVVGIWGLLRDDHTNELTDEATALREAYRAIYEFEPIAAVFSAEPGTVYFIKSAPPQKVDKYLALKKKMDQTWPGIETRWEGLKRIGFDRIDAAFAGTSLPPRRPVKLAGYPLENLDDIVFLFRKDHYIWLDYLPKNVPADIHLRPISEGWPGVPFNHIDADAALNVGPKFIYFFSGDEYIRFNWTSNKADFEPRKFRDHWKGVTFDRIDAAIYWGNGKVYFFRGDRYIVYDMVTYRADPGNPKYLPGSYVEGWKIFD